MRMSPEAGGRIRLEGETVPALELRLFGSPGVFLEGFEVALPTKKALALLAYLALEGPTPRGKLADLLWSDLEEDTARKNLRQEFHRLQSTPLAEHLTFSPDKIWVGGNPQADIRAFRACVRDEDWAGAISAYRGALLAGLELRGAARFDEWLEATRASLAGEYRKALRHRSGQLEGEGNLRAALETHQTLLVTEPFEEHTYREAMRLHALLGEREAALNLYRRCREMLEREFALKPLPETAELAERIRRTEAPASAPVTPPVLRAPNLNPPLVGRAREWERLEAAFAEKRVVYVAGEAGMGKTRLLREFGASKGGCHVLQGHPSDLSVPYATLTRGMRALLAEGKVQLLPWERRELSRLLPELSDEPPPPIQSEFEKLRLFGAYTEAYWRATCDIPLMIGEDIHWFDPASGELAGYMETQLAQTGRWVSSFATFRPEDLNPQVWAMVRATTQAGRGELIELGPLGEVGVAELVSRLSGEPVTVFPRRIHKATGGNPFFVLETLKGLFESGELRLNERGVWATPYDEETEDYRELPIPQSVRTAVLARVERQGRRPVGSWRSPAWRATRSASRT